MAAAGWYPDPGGAPGHFRWWDGAAWSAETTTNPSDPPPGGGAPAAPPRRRGASVWIVGLVLVAVLVLVVAVVISWRNGDRTPLRNDAGPSSTVSGWDDSSPIPTESPTPRASESPTPSEAPQGRVACADGDPAARRPHPGGDRLYGGSLSIPQPTERGWERNDRYAQAMTWAYDISGAYEAVEPRWWAMVAVGELRTEDGFHDPEQAADGVLQCVASSVYYQYFTGRKDVHSKKVTVDGVTGWSIRAEVRVDDPDVEAEGDVVEVIVLDTGPEGSLSYFAGFVPIGDASRIEILDRVIADLQVQ